jgi:hypothetical protein
VLRKGGPGKAFRSSDIGGIAGFLSELLAGQPVRPSQRADYSWANIGRRLDGVLRQVLDDSFVREMPACRQI